jgi:hypothetical protein
MRLEQIGVIALLAVMALPAADLPTPLSSLLDEATRSNGYAANRCFDWIAVLGSLLRRLPIKAKGFPIAPVCRQPFHFSQLGEG